MLNTQTQKYGEDSMIMQKLDETIYIGGNGDDDSGPSTPDRRPGEGNIDLRV